MKMCSARTFFLCVFVQRKCILCVAYQRFAWSLELKLSLCHPTSLQRVRMNAWLVLVSLKQQFFAMTRQKRPHDYVRAQLND